VAVADLVEHGLIGDRDVGRIARQRGPAERPAALAELRPDVRRHEAGVAERALAAALLGLGAQVVAVVEDVAAGGLHRQHRLDLHRHRRPRARDVVVRIPDTQRGGLGQRVALRDVAVQRIVGRGLIGDQIGQLAAAHQLGVDVGGVGDDRDRLGLALGGVGPGPAQAVVERVGDLVEVAGLEAALDAGGIDLDRQAHAAGHHHRQRLRAAHAAEPGGQDQLAAEVGAPVGAAGGGEGLVGALQDALGADVDPRPGGHLAVHHQALAIELAEVLPGGPAADQVGVGDQHPRRLVVGLPHADRRPDCTKQRLVALEPPQLAHDRVVVGPRPRRLAEPAVDDQLARALGDVGIEVVHQHAQRGLLRPALARQLGASRGADDGGVGGHGSSFTGGRRRRGPRPEAIRRRSARAPRRCPAPAGGRPSSAAPWRG
jgi:hypothetical protein